MQHSFHIECAELFRTKAGISSSAPASGCTAPDQLEQQIRWFSTPHQSDTACLCFFCGYDPGQGENNSSTLHGQQGAAFAIILQLMHQSVLGRYMSCDLLLSLLKLHVCHSVLRTVVLLTRNLQIFFPSYDRPTII